MSFKIRGCPVATTVPTPHGALHSPAPTPGRPSYSAGASCAGWPKGTPGLQFLTGDLKVAKLLFIMKAFHKILLITYCHKTWSLEVKAPRGCCSPLLSFPLLSLALLSFWYLPLPLFSLLSPPLLCPSPLPLSPSFFLVTLFQSTCLSVVREHEHQT